MRRVLSLLPQVKLLAQLNHPYVLGYIESFQHKNHLCIITEFCEGGDLYTRLKVRREPFAPIAASPIAVPSLLSRPLRVLQQCKSYLKEEQVMEWFVQIALAMQYIHSKKVCSSSWASIPKESPQRSCEIWSPVQLQ